MTNEIKRLLVIDDETDILNLVQAYLKKDDRIEVTTMQNPVDAFDLIRSKMHFFDLIICDINMPNMSGIELLKKIRSHGIKTKWIFYTAYSNYQNELQNDENLDVTAYKEKPMRKNHFVQFVMENLEISNKI